MSSLLAQRRGHARARDAGAKSLRLDHCPLGEVAAGDPRRKPQVILDARTASCLASDYGHLDDQGAQSFRGAIDCRRETSWPRTDDEEVEAAFGKAVDGQAEILRQPSWGRAAQDRTRDDHDRQLARRDTQLAQQMVDSSVAVRVQPLMGDPVARQELADRQ